MSGVGFSLAPSKQVSITELIDLVCFGEQLRYDSVWIPETWGVDAVSVLSLLAHRTSSICIASGVFNVYSRSAGLLAQTAATLQELSQGRFVLGLGASGPAVIENWHGMRYRQPVERTADYVAIIRLALSGQRVDYEGATTTVRGFKLTNPPATPVPIYIAALGPRNVEMTARVADGWLPIFAPRGRMSVLLREFIQSATRVDRRLDEFDVATYIPALVGPRADRLLRQQLAYYLGGMGTFYANFMRQMGFDEEVDSVRRLWAEGDRVSAVDAISTQMLNECTLSADPSIGIKRLAQYQERGLKSPIVTMPNGASVQEIRATLEELAPRP